MILDGIVLPQIRTIEITTSSGVVMKVLANQFIPWKFVMDTSKDVNEVVAYMCCTKVETTLARDIIKNSVMVTKEEYDRLVDKYKAYQENNTSMIEGFVDQSEPPEMPKAPWLDPPPALDPLRQRTGRKPKC